MKRNILILSGLLMGWFWVIGQVQPKSNLLVCHSLEDAFTHGDKVGILMLRNQKNLSEIPAEIGQLTNLRILNVSGTDVTKLPEELAQCTRLEEIIANASKIASIPSSFGKLKELKVLNFAYNRIRDIPQTISNCSQLKWLNLSDNQIQRIPEGFGKLQELTFCGLGNNRLTEFSDEFLKLDGVFNLWLHGNEIYFIPTEIASMRSLTHLLIDASEVKNIEDIRSLCPDLRIIDENNRK